jgi:hypothetical protein
MEHWDSCREYDADSYQDCLYLSIHGEIGIVPFHLFPDITDRADTRIFLGC